MSNPDWLARAAQRSQEETWMLGHVFERYRELEGCSQEQLAKELGCTREVLHWLSLCRHPEGEGFNEQVSTIARRFAVELLPLVQVLRRVEVMDALSARDEPGAVTEDGPMLMAARDRTEDEEVS
jgi:transcriptional regulator with XRE-family HTH domain